MRGFTLIELLIVIAIILILIAIALPNFLESQIRAKVTKVMGDMRTLSIAIESYNIDFRQYPYGQGRHRFKGNVPANPEYAPLSVLTTPHRYLTEIPPDPFTDQPTDLSPDTATLTFWYLSREYREDMGWPWIPRWTWRGYREWLLASPGPSNDVDRFTYLEEESYSPTNGTKSLGGIFRGGPSGKQSL